MRRALALTLSMALAGLAAGGRMGQAQTPGTPAVGQGVAPVVTLDQDRLFAESQFGRAVNAQAEQENRDLAAEFRKIEAALEEEERRLTTQRATLPPAEFRKLADEFDSRVEAVRKAQDGKSRSLVRRQEEDRKKFYDTALPILGQLMGERGAVAILNRDAIVLSFDRIDITDAAIARLDAELGDGTAGPPQPGPSAPAPEPEPAVPEVPVPEPPTPEPAVPEPAVPGP